MLKALALCCAVVLCCSVASANAQETSTIAHVIAPGGRLRAAINFGNPVLAQRDPQTGEARGVSVALARELARRLGVPLEIVGYDAAGKVTDALANDAWDVAFLAIDPVRANAIAFTPPYVVIEGAYVVPQSSPLQANDDVDRAGVRIAVGRGSAYDLYLTRTIKHAQLVRAATSPAALDLFLNDKLDAGAGVKQPVVKFAAQHPGLRVLPGRFMVIEQAMALPKGRSAGSAYLASFVEELKASGFVDRALAESGQGG